MDWTENQQCVLCDKGGNNLLVCSDDGCPIFVHKDCMGCEAHFDDGGNFRCPYCVYKQCTAEAGRLRAKVMLTKKALSTFLETGTGDENRQEVIVEMAGKEDGSVSKDKAEGSRMRSNVMLTKKALSTFLERETGDENRQEVIVEMGSKEGGSVSKDRAESSQMRSNVILTKKTLSTFVETGAGDENCQEPIVEMGSKEDEALLKDKAEGSQMRSNIMLTKKALSTVLEKGTGDENSQDSMARKEGEALSKDKVVDENHNDSLDSCDEISESISHEDSNEIVKGNEGAHEVSNVNTCRMMVVYNPNTDHDSKRMRVDQETGNDGCRFKVFDQEEQSESRAIMYTTDKHIPFKKRNRSVRFNMNGRKEELVKDNGAKKESKQLSMIGRNTRCRVFWSEQEEEMLKEGVQKFSAFTKKNLPWKKILEFGRHVFDSSRSPSDLKDKWRKFAK